MPVRKYLINDAGQTAEESALVVSTGAPDEGAIPALDNTGRLDTSVMPVGIGADTAIITASEALAAGDFVNIWDSAGDFRARKADATVEGKEAHGFVLAAVLANDPATVYFEGPNTQVVGQTPGVVFLSTTPGVADATAPSASGNIVQRIGFAVSATVINFQSQMPIRLA